MAVQLFIPTFEVEECLAEIRECLEKGWTGLGFKTVQLEDAWKKYTGLPHAHFLNSATVGLQLAVQVLKEEYKWNDGDEIISTPLTFVSTNHAIVYEGMKVIFADVDQYLCLDPVEVEKKITDKTRAVMFVGLGGNCGQYQKIVKLCKKHNLKLILDAAHMAGTRLNGEIPGAEADVVVYSFQAVKNLPTADSGMICFKEEAFDAIVRKKAWLGINKDTYARSNDKGAYKWKYDVEYVGYKHHGNSIVASIGLVQLKYLERDNAYRRQLAVWYDQAFLGHEAKVKAIPVAPGCESSRHLYQIEVNNRDEMILALNESEIYPGVHYVDNTEYKMYAYAAGTCANSERMSNRIISLPMHMRLTKEDVDTVAAAVLKYAK
ncbi:DegT/DnrJ/EryC1/StrS family aminotransferase [Azotosporobacter soli]|uniref:DegT/DnrJ/EryC1/StrS family aminotransferase n=1 Tax=Azotosporobacter soli TaxID=3055040 RepID=UPI0031FEABF9